MRSPFYQANFCAECGNSLETRLSFKPRYFCDDCAARLKQRSLAKPLASLLLIISMALFVFSYKQGSYTQSNDRKSDTTVQQLDLLAPASPVSAQDSIVNSRTNSRHEASPKVLCGARTRRGTPCRHLVQSGQRCAQHRGMSSMLDSTSTISPSKSPTKSGKH